MITPAKASTARSTFISLSLSFAQTIARCSPRPRVGSCGPGQMAACPGHDASRIHGAGRARDDLSAAQQEQRRNAADAEFGCDCGLLVRVDLEQPNIRLELDGGLLEHRCHDPAGP